MVYEWDAEKAKRNLQKHHISFEDAATVFLDPLAMTFPDPDHSSGEDREITLGRSLSQQVVFVSHCPGEDRTRIISARKATRSERNQYEESIDKRIE
ncbi:MAG TPA: BrnT family toxin [Terriglobia bacterium]|nr:BrnT family toxin [Terriglobia bacterium]